MKEDLEYTVKESFDDVLRRIKERTGETLKKIRKDPTPKRSAKTGIDYERQRELIADLRKRNKGTVDVEEARDLSLFTDYKRPVSSKRKDREKRKELDYNIDDNKRKRNRGFSKAVTGFIETYHAHTQEYLPLNQARRIVRELIGYGLPLTFRSYKEMKKLEVRESLEKDKLLEPIIKRFIADYEEQTGEVMSYREAERNVRLLSGRGYEVSYTGVTSYMKDRSSREEVVNERRVSSTNRTNGFRNKGKLDST